MAYSIAFFISLLSAVFAFFLSLTQIIQLSGVFSGVTCTQALFSQAQKTDRHNVQVSCGRFLELKNVFCVVPHLLHWEISILTDNEISFCQGVEAVLEGL